MSKSLYTVRKKKKEKHPQVVVGVTRTSFDSLKLTHSKRTGKRSNIRLIHNPNQTDNRTSYLSKQIVRDFKFRFSKAFKNYRLSNEDIDQIIKYLESKKR